MGKLTVMKVRAITEPGRYGDGGTLYLHVAPGGSKSWVQRLTIRGERCDMGLGAFPLVTLAEAREKAFDNRRLARSGGDPRIAKRRATVPTFREAACQTFDALRPTWRSAKHAATWFQVLERHAFPELADMRVDQIERQDVLRVLKPIWSKLPETARRVRTRIRAVLAWCESEGFVGANVAERGLDGALPRLRRRASHFKAIPYVDMARILRVLEAGPGSPNAKLSLRFTVLTAARSKETREARWEEMHLKDRLWIVPAHRMKAEAEHRQPLSAPALEVLARARALDDGSGFVFPSAQKRGRPLSEAGMMKVVHSNGLGGRMTVHGCRATFRTWASECTESDHAVMELSLAHQVGSAVERAYARGELLRKRRLLMEQWASYVTAPASVSPTGSDDPGSGVVLPLVSTLSASGSLSRGAESHASLRRDRLSGRHLGRVPATVQLGLFNGESGGESGG